MRKILLLIGLSLLMQTVGAIPKGKIRIEITPDHTEDWCYQVGDSVAYDVVVTVDGKPLENASV